MSDKRAIHDTGKDRGPTTMPVETSDENSNSSELGLVSLRHHPAIWFAPAVVLMLAVLPLPYGFYIFLRLAVFLVAVYLGYTQWKRDDSFSVWVITLGAIALLYNPILPIHLTREMWIVFNLLTAGIFIAHLCYIKRLLKSTSRDHPNRKGKSSNASSSFGGAVSDNKHRGKEIPPRVAGD